MAALALVAALLAGEVSTASAQGKIYWTDINRGDVESAPKAGPYVAKLEAVSGGAPTGLAVDPFDGLLYWSNAAVSPPGIFKAQINNPYVVQMVVPAVDAQDIALDLSRGHIYWIDRISDEIARADLSSGRAQNQVSLVSGNIEEPRALELDLRNGQVYWADQAFDWIQRANLDGSGRETVVSGITADAIESIALDLSPELAVAPNGRIYWTEHDDAGGIAGVSRILRANIASPGGAIPRIVVLNDTLGIIAGVAVDERAGQLYWANRGGGDTISRAELDGSNPMPLIGTNGELGQPYAIVLDDVFCGNGRVDGEGKPNGEECDDGNFADRDGCDQYCQSECGNGRVDGEGKPNGEECDDGNTNGTPNGAEDGCSATCKLDRYWQCPTEGAPCSGICGDGKVRGGENCDDGNVSQIPEDGCDASCRKQQYWTCPPAGGTCDGICGDGQTKGSEVCDDGNTLNCVGDCSRDCRKSITGCDDGEVCGGEECDPPNALTCSADCKIIPHCGDGQIETGVCRPPLKSCATNADCNAADGYGRCDAGQCLVDSAYVGGACSVDSPCPSGRVCYSEPCDDTNMRCWDGSVFTNGTCTTDAECGSGQRCLLDNSDDCIIDNGVCKVADCNDGFLRSHPANDADEEDCDTPNGARCDDKCQTIPGSSCRKRLAGLSFAKADPTGKGRLRKRAYTEGSEDEDGQRDGECQFAINVCLAIPLDNGSTGNPATPTPSGCHPMEVYSLDFSESVPVGVTAGDWRAAEVECVSRRVGALMLDARVAGRCMEGLSGKQCSVGDDNECDRFLGSGDGRCGPGSGVEFLTPLTYDPAGGQCMTVNVRVKEGERLRLRSRARGLLSDGPEVRLDSDRLRLVCRPGSGPTVIPGAAASTTSAADLSCRSTPTPTSTPAAALASATPPPIPTDTPSMTPTATDTPTPLPTDTDTPAATPSPSASETATDTPTTAPTITSTAIPTGTATRTPTRRH